MSDEPVIYVTLSPPYEPLVDAELFYSEDQPRDDQGRWTSTGGTRDAGVEWKQSTDKDGRPVPIKVATVEEAIPLVLEGKVVELSEVRQVNTLIDKLGEMARDAAAKGEKAPTYDLCNVTVGGTNLFCADRLRTKDFPSGIPRIQMPQLAGEPTPGSAAALLSPSFPGKTEVDGGQHFISYMTGLGYPVKEEQVLAASLKASQAELVGLKVGGIMKAAATNRGIIDSPIFVSRDGYIVDGHHRWAAVVGLDTARGKFTTKMNIHRVDAPITEVLRLANVWSARFGIAQAAGPQQRRKHAAEGGEQFEAHDVSDEPRDYHGRWADAGASSEPLAGDAGKVADRLNKIATGDVDKRIASDPDVALLAKSGKEFKQDGLVVVGGEDHECHTNTAKYWLTQQVDSIATGYAKTGNLWTQHTWGLKGGKIVETTARMERYFGVKLSDRDALKFARAQGVDYHSTPNASWWFK